LLEGSEAIVAMHDGLPLYLDMPASVVMEITHTDPGLQGDRSSAGTKPATIETDYQIQVPLFLETGTKVKVDTRSGEYLGRVNDSCRHAPEHASAPSTASTRRASAAGPAPPTTGR